MRRFCIATLLIVSASSTAPVHIELVITQKVALRGELEDLVTFGLLKEMNCDSAGNIFSPSNRKYGDALNAIVRFPPDATSFTKFSIDALPHLEDGTIVDFDLEPNGDLYVLARQVLKYSEVNVPIQFGENFVVHYDTKSQVLSQLQLKLNTENFAPTGLALLKSGEFLVVGYKQEDGKTFIIGQITRPDGSLKTRFELNPGGTKTSNEKAASGARVFHPIAIKANGFVYVMRGTTTEPVYLLSETGQLIKTIELRPLGLEFDSPKIIGDDLIVQAHTIPSDEDNSGIENNSGMKVRTTPYRRSFPIFSLKTGNIVAEYYWHQESLGLACYSPGLLTFIGQELSLPLEWAIFQAKPAGSATAKTSLRGF